MKKNRLTVFSKSKQLGQLGRLNQIKKACKNNNIEFHLPMVKTWKDFAKHLPSFGPVVYCQMTPLSGIEQRIAIKQIISSNRKIINQKNAEQGFITRNKYYQQMMVESANICETIPTYRFNHKKNLLKALTKGTLKLPFILKKSRGSVGRQVHLITYKKDIKNIPYSMHECIIQPYIQNDEDFRVWIIGNKCIGAAKRTPKPGEFRTHGVHGGTMEKVTDKQTLQKLKDISLGIAKCLELDHVGIDIIHDTEKNVFRFMETNSTPDWRNFSKVTGIDIPDKLVKYAKKFMK